MELTQGGTFTDFVIYIDGKIEMKKIPAASSGTMNNVTFGGYDPSRKINFTYYETIGGGMGRSFDCSGLSRVHIHMTNSPNTPMVRF